MGTGRVSQRIQIVEDTNLLRGLFQAQLTARGFDVRTASDGESALEQFAEDCPDLVLMDINLPGADGLEVARRMRQERLVPILFMTAGTSADVRTQALSIERTDFLLKPFDAQTLVARIYALLTNEAH